MKNMGLTSILLSLCFVLPNISMTSPKDFMSKDLNGWVKSTTIKRYSIYMQSGEIKKNELIGKTISKYSTIV